jgi:hypothetical protein
MAVIASKIIYARVSSRVTQQRNKELHGNKPYLNYLCALHHINLNECKKIKLLYIAIVLALFCSISSGIEKVVQDS